VARAKLGNRQTKRNANLRKCVFEIMPRTKMVITTAFIVECEGEVNDVQLREGISKAKEMIKAIAIEDLSLIPTRAYSAFWTLEAPNLGLCENCNELTSDRTHPEFVGGVCEGSRQVDGEYVCFECLSLREHK
jgi:hypothetical protein